MKKPSLTYFSKGPNDMTKLTLIAIMILSFAAFAQTVRAQDIPSSLSVDDVKLFRKIIADRDYEKARADEAVRQRDEWKKSAADWEALFRSEKDRADRVQGGRVEELGKANFELHNQNDALKREKRELEDDLVSCKSSRKYYFIGGATLGGAAGTYVGYKIGKSNRIPGLGDQTFTQPRPQFGFRLKF
jgi:hypothetical protein